MKSSPISYNNNEGRQNEEWPELINVDAKIGETFKIKTNLPAETKPKKEINVKNLSTNDLKSIKKQDPFMYFSIPGVRSAKVLMREIDTSNLGASVMSRNCFSCPSRIQTVQSQDTTTNTVQQTVSRKSCISYECHPDLLFMDELDGMEEDEMEIDFDDSDLGSFVSSFMNGQ